MFLGAVPRRPEKAAALKQLKSHVIMFGAWVAVVRATPYILHYFCQDHHNQQLKLELKYHLKVVEVMKYGEITHFSHPEHELKFEYIELPFKCDGCKEMGIGSRYNCNTCDFDLHMHCALPSPTITHPFYLKCSFQFLSQPPGDVPRFCNACEKDVTGFVYHCKSCGFDLHPCCAKLPLVLDDGETKLYLNRKVSSACHQCGRKGRSWSYRSGCKEHNLHVACAKEMLVEILHDLYLGHGGSGTILVAVASFQCFRQLGTSVRMANKEEDCRL